MAAPDRKEFDLILIMIILTAPALGLVHLWFIKELVKAPEGTLRHKAAQVGGILT